MLSYFQLFKLTIRGWIGKRVDFDKAYGYQCVDFIKQYCRETGYPVTTSGNAIDLWKRGLGDKFIRIDYMYDRIPNPGDVVIWSGPSKYGHIAIADAGCTASLLKVIEQNGATGNGRGTGGDAIRYKSYNYTSPKVLGWYRHK